MEPMTVPVTGNATLDHWLAVFGLVTSIASTAASILNGKIRAALDAGEEIPALFLWLGLAVNTVALNVDKAAQMQKLLKGSAVVVTRVGGEKNEV